MHRMVRIVACPPHRLEACVPDGSRRANCIVPTEGVVFAALPSVAPVQSIGVRDYNGIAAHETLFGSVNGDGYVAWYDENWNSLMELGWWDGGSVSMNVYGGFYAYNISADSLTLSGSPVLSQAGSDARYDARYLRKSGSGVTTLVFGTASIATGDHAISLGKGTQALGLGAVALGATNQENGRLLQAYAKGSTAIGYGAQSSGEGAVAMGWDSAARGRASVAIGEYTWTAPAAEGAVALGNLCWAEGAGSVPEG